MNEGFILHMNKSMFNPPDIQELLPSIRKITGYPRNTEADSAKEARLYKAFEKVLSLIEPIAKVACDKITNYDDKTVKGKRFVIESMHLGRLVTELKEADLIIFYAITAGSAVDDEIKRMQDISLYDACMLHAAGAATIDHYAGQLESFLRGRAVAEGLDITARFSPGYCDWNLTIGQDLIFNFLKPESIGLRKLRSGFMIPEKSISGITIQAKGIRNHTACAYCQSTDCKFRREPLVS